MPEITDAYAQSVSDRYLELSQHTTGTTFHPADTAGDLARRIENNVTKWLTDRSK